MKASSPITTLIGHRAEISNAQFDFTGTRLVSSSIDSTAKVWEVSSGKCIATLS